MITLATTVVLSLLTTLAFTIFVSLEVSVLWNSLSSVSSIYVVLIAAFFFAIRKQYDDLNARAASLAAVGPVIAHELRTPLESIRLIGNTLRKEVGARDQTVAESTKEIVTEAESAFTLIDILLVNTSPDSKGAQSQGFGLNDAVIEAISRFPYASPKDQAILHVELAEEVEVYGPRLLFIHVVFNLLKNAIENVAVATDPKIEIGSTLADGNVELWVEDNGGNIDAETAERMFDRFFSRSGGNAAGIGLSFCKETVQNRFGGQIACEFDPGRFTRLIVTIPVARTVNR